VLATSPLELRRRPRAAFVAIPDMNATTPPASAVALLVETMYRDLRQLAHRERRRAGGGSETLRTTALVHEAYLKLARHGLFRDRGHFLATAALAIRQVLVTHARSRMADKRGRGLPPLPLDEADGVLAEREERIVALDEALLGLEGRHPRCARVVECRYFAGLSEADTALALGVTERTVQRDWAKAKALLYELMGAD
jgi:RNA polymerase sigma factor (TIGR02999 family)